MPSPHVQSESCFHCFLSCHFSGPAPWPGLLYSDGSVPLAFTSVLSLYGRPFVPGLLCGRTVPFGLTQPSRPGLALVLVLEPSGLGYEASWSFALRLPSRFSLGPSPTAAQAQPVAPFFVPPAGVGQR